MSSLVRAVAVAFGLAAWFATQAWIGKRRAPKGRIVDRLHDLTAPWHAALVANPKAANAVLVASSLGIDLLGLFLLGAAIFGPTMRPFVGLLVIYALRQACQGLVALPTPPGMIWRSPGFPSLLVTYGVANDLFFSGHTAIATWGAIELWRWGGPGWGTLGATVAAAEAAVVLILRAHYTMDVFTAVVTALWAAGIAAVLAPPCDAALAALAGGF